MTNIEYTPIVYLNDDKLMDVYQAPDAALLQKLHPSSVREDTLKPSSYSDRRNDYIYQQGKAFMPLVHRMKCNFTVTLVDNYYEPTKGNADDTPNLAGNYIISGPGITPMSSSFAPINNQNFQVDAFALSKMHNYISVKFGESELYTTNNGTDRNPLLIEAKSMLFDLRSCEEFDEPVLLQSGYGFIGNVASKGFLPRRDAEVLTPSAALLQNPLSFSSEGNSHKVALKWHHGKDGRRWRIVGTPTFTAVGLGPLYPFLTRDNEWVPSTTGPQAVLGAGDPDLYQGRVKAVYEIEVEEYIVETFLKTPYEKNKNVRSVLISPNNYVNISYQTNIDYIQSIFKWNSQSRIGTTNEGDANKSYMKVQYNPQNTELYVQSFDVAVRPAGFTYNLLAYEPSRMVCSTNSVNLKTLSLGKEASMTDGTLSDVIKIFDQTSSVLSQVYLITADPELTNGLQDSVLTVAGCGRHNFSNFVPASIENLRIWIDQIEITENIIRDFIIRSSLTVTGNDAFVNPLLRNDDKYYEMLKTANILRSRGVPFLFLDFTKFTTANSSYVQYLANVMYAEMKTIRIEFQLKGQQLSLGESLITPGEIAPPVTLKYIPHIYRFTPYLYKQSVGKAITKVPVYDDYTRVKDIINNPSFEKRTIDLNMVTGGSLLESTKSFLSKYSNDILKGLMGVVRVAEGMTRNTEFKNAHNILKSVSDVGRNYGYGRR